MKRDLKKIHSSEREGGRSRLVFMYVSLMSVVYFVSAVNEPGYQKGMADAARIDRTLRTWCPKRRRAKKERKKFFGADRSESLN
jgi:hypothetical protein